MKEKEPTSLKAISQATCPYPTTPRPSSQSSRSRPKYFPPNVLQEEDLERTMDLIPYIPDPPSPHSPPSKHSPPDTLTPTSHTNRVHPLNPDPPIYQEFSVKSSPDPNNSETPTNGLTSSIHAPGNPSHYPPPICPSSKQGFPNSAHVTLCANLRPPRQQGLLAWFQVMHPKFMIRVFDHSRKDIAERAAIVAEHIRANITTIVESIHHDTPLIPIIRVSPPQLFRGVPEVVLPPLSTILVRQPQLPRSPGSPKKQSFGPASLTAGSGPEVPKTPISHPEVMATSDSRPEVVQPDDASSVSDGGPPAIPTFDITIPSPVSTLSICKLSIN
ncbi:hypothetical protein BDR05DRAFT_951388 [Suillus weaverae]|nr:hypothetical protein BDR05DRAFT_951388 [Suillus weaverae]